MPIPEAHRAVIEPEKIRDYLLNTDNPPRLVTAYPEEGT